MVLSQFAFMWGSETYQFFPVAIGAAVTMLYARSHELQKITIDKTDSDDGTFSLPPNVYLITVALALNVSLLMFARTVQSSWLGWISLILFLSTIAYSLFGWSGWKIVFPTLVVLLAIRPVPELLELTVTVGMQQFASKISSWLLDAIGILHYRQGTVLVLANQLFMAEEACSGIRSLFSSVTAILVWGLMNRYHWFRNVLNVVQTIFWVIVFNALRITVVVWVEHSTDFSIASGWKHDIVGLIVFFLIFATTLSTNQLMGIYAPIPDEFVDDRDDSSATELAADNPSSRTATTSSLQWNGSAGSAIFWCSVFGVLAIASLRLSYLDYNYQYNSISTEQSLTQPESAFLPSRIDEWQTISFEHEHRSERHNMGSDSYIWKLVNTNGKAVLVSIDGVFDDYHELAVCYDGLGWDVSREVFYAKDSEQADDSEPVSPKLTRLDLKKRTGETGLVLFTAVDKNGGIVLPQPSKATDLLTSFNEKAIGTFRALIGKQAFSGSREAFFLPPVSTIQMVYQPTTAITEEDATEVRSLFLQVREILRKSPRFVTAKSS